MPRNIISQNESAPANSIAANLVDEPVVNIEDLDKETCMATEAEKAGDKLLIFVEKQVDKMNNKILFDGNREPSLYELQMALSTYEQTMFGLVAMYEQAKYDAEVAKSKYKEFYATKFMETRNKYNTLDTAKSKWLSANEIEFTMQSIYKKELAMLETDRIEKEAERSTLERLMRSWESYQFVLTQLSKNSIAQMGGSRISTDLPRGDEDDLFSPGI